MEKNYYQKMEQEVNRTKRDFAIEIIMLSELKKQEDSLSFYVKVKRLTKNAGLELAASLIEGFFVPCQLGGLKVNCNKIRERKTPNRYRSMKRGFEKRYFPRKEFVR